MDWQKVNSASAAALWPLMCLSAASDRSGWINVQCSHSSPAMRYSRAEETGPHAEYMEPW